LTIANVDGADVFHIPISAQCFVVAIDAARVATSVHQHFLKQDAVFFDVLVYSE